MSSTIEWLVNELHPVQPLLSKNFLVLLKFTFFLLYSSKPARKDLIALAATAPVPTQPSQAQAQPVPVAQSGGMLSNILQTAAGVAVGHTVGRMVSGLFEGNSVDSNGNAEQTTKTSIQCQADTKTILGLYATKL